MAQEKSVSAKELKTFIEAVEFAADSDNWIPSERQWKRIRSMIDRLEEHQPPSLSNPTEAPMTYAQPMPKAPEPVMLAPGGLMQMPTGPVQRGPLNGPFAIEASHPVRTPDVDTSNGQYTSSFA